MTNATKKKLFLSLNFISAGLGAGGSLWAAHYNLYTLGAFAYFAGIAASYAFWRAYFVLESN